MTPDESDRDWWLSTAPSLKWTWAKTYAQTAPHWYVVLGRTEGITREDFIRAGRVIRAFGEPGKFWNSTNVYLFSRDRRLKMWCVWSSPPEDSDSTLINLAYGDNVYGPQREFDEARLRELRLLH